MRKKQIFFWTFLTFPACWVIDFNFNNVIWKKVLECQKNENIGKKATKQLAIHYKRLQFVNLTQKKYGWGSLPRTLEEL